MVANTGVLTGLCGNLCCGVTGLVVGEEGIRTGAGDLKAAEEEGDDEALAPLIIVGLATRTTVGVLAREVVPLITGTGEVTETGEFEVVPWTTGDFCGLLFPC